MKTSQDKKSISRAGKTSRRTASTTGSKQDNGASVERIQRLLNKKGYGPLDVDGIYGNATRTAVERFQMAMGLVVDGIVGPNTMAALEAKNSRPQRPVSKKPRNGRGDPILQHLMDAKNQAQQDELYDILRAAYDRAKVTYAQTIQDYVATWHVPSNYATFDDANGHVTLIGARGFDPETFAPCNSTKEQWDDTMFVLVKEAGVKRVYWFKLNTEPNRGNESHCSWVVEGHHRYKLGLHKGRRALEPVTGTRQTIGGSGARSWNSNLNIHDGGTGPTSAGWSEGCQTLWGERAATGGSGYPECIALCEKDWSLIGTASNEIERCPPRDGTRAVIYCLLLGYDIVNTRAVL